MRVGGNRQALGKQSSLLSDLESGGNCEAEGIREMAATTYTPPSHPIGEKSRSMRILGCTRCDEGRSEPCRSVASPRPQSAVPQVKANVDSNPTASRPEIPS